MNRKWKAVITGLLGIQILLGQNSGFAETFPGPITSNGEVFLFDGDRVESGTIGIRSNAGGMIEISGAATIDVDNRVASGTKSGIEISNTNLHKLGDGSTIHVYNNAGSGTGINLLSGGSIQAERLNIDIDATGAAIGIDGSYYPGSVIDLGNESSIKVKGSLAVGIELNHKDTQLNANRIQIEAESSGGGHGIRVDAGKADLGVGSSIKTSGSSGVSGILAMGTSSTVTADQLTIDSNHYGLNIQNGAVADIGKGSVITSNSSIVQTVWAVGTDAKLTAKEATFIQKGAASSVLSAQNGGFIEIGEGSKVIAEQQGGMVASNGTINFFGSQSKRNKIQSVSNYAISAQQTSGLLNIKYTDIDTTSTYGLWAVNSAVINMENSTMNQTGGRYGVVAQGGGKVNLSGDVALKSSSGILAVVDGASSKLQGTAKLDLEGTVIAQNNGTVDLTMTSGSLWTGGAIENSGMIHLNLTGSTWNLNEENSSVTDLVLNNSVVNFQTDGSDISRAGQTYDTLTIGNLSGNNGLFKMRTDIQNLNGDLLDITGTSSGNHKVFITNQGDADVNGTERLTVVKTADGIADFAMTNIVELGGYQYTLHRNPDQTNEWELFGTKSPANSDPEGPSQPANAGINLFSGSYLLNYAEMNSFMQRMGDLRQGDAKGGIWVRTYGGKFESNGDSFLRGYDMNYWGLQVGADQKISRKDQKGDWYVGGMFGYSNGNVDYGYGEGSIDSKSIGAYGTYIAKNGFYADLALKYNWLKDDFKVLDSVGDRVTGKDITTHGISASMEVGRRYHFDKVGKNEGWYIEPQAQLVAGHYSGDDFKASNGLRFAVDSYNSVLGRVGMNIGKEIKSGKNPINAYAKVSYVHEFAGDVNYYLNSSKEKSSFGDSWWTYGAGITAQISKKHNIYLDVEQATGGKFDQSWAINGGYRFTW